MQESHLGVMKMCEHQDPWIHGKACMRLGVQKYPYGVPDEKAGCPCKRNLALQKVFWVPYPETLTVGSLTIPCFKCFIFERTQLNVTKELQETIKSKDEEVAYLRETLRKLESGIIERVVQRIFAEVILEIKKPQGVV